MMVVHRQDDIERKQGPDSNGERQREADQLELGEHKPDQKRVSPENRCHHDAAPSVDVRASRLSSAEISSSKAASSACSVPSAGVADADGAVSAFSSPKGVTNGLVGPFSIILALLQEAFKSAWASVRGRRGRRIISSSHADRCDLDGGDGEEIGATPVARADEIALGRGLLREGGATTPPRDIGQEAALGQPIVVHLDLLLTQPLGITLKATFDLRFRLGDLALDVIRP